MDNPIQIDGPAQDQSPLIDIDTSVSPNIPLSPDVASSRATKANFGLSKQTDKTYEDYTKAITDGNEEGMRRDASSQVDQSNYLKSQQTVQDIVKGKSALSSLDVKLVQNAVDKGTKTTDPSSIFEEKFAEEYMNYLHWPSQPPDASPWWDSAIMQIPEQVQQTKDQAQEIIAKREYLLTHAQNLEATLKDQSYLGWGADLAKQFFQPYVEAKKRGNVPGVGLLEGGLLGSNLSAQRDKLLSLPLAEFKSTVDSFVTNLKQNNPSLAMSFVNDMLGQSSTDKFVNNAFSIAAPFDAAAATKLGWTASKLALYKTLRKSAADMVKASGEATTQAPRVVASAASGDVEEAAVQKATAQVVSDLKGGTNPEKSAIDAQTSNFNFSKPFEVDPARYGQELVNRIQDRYITTQSNFMDKLESMYRVNRTPALLTTENVVRSLKDEIKGTYKGVDNAILDVKGPIYHPDTNTYHWDIPIGTSDGSYFKDRRTAQNNANLNGLIVKPTVYQEINSINQQLGKLPKDAPERVALRAQKKAIVDLGLGNNDYLPNREGYEVKQQGKGFYISYTKPLRETDDIMRDGLIQTNTALPNSKLGNWVNATLGWIRTPEETMSVAERGNRKIVTHTPSILMDTAKDVSLDISKVPYKYKKEFGRALQYAQRMPDPVDGVPGHFFDNAFELHDFYLRTFQRAPHPSEIQAYAAYKHLTEFDHSLRNVAVLRNKLRLGVESHSVSAIGSDGKRVSSQFFDGIAQKQFPGGNDNILVMGRTVGEEKIYKASLFPTEIKKTLTEAVDKGEAKVIRVFDPEAKPLNDFSDKTAGKRVRYVISYSAEQKPISYSQVPKRGGGHLIPDYEWYLKEADIHQDEIGKAAWYNGDKTIMPISNRAMAQDIAKHMNEVKRLLREGDVAGAKDYHLNSKLPMDWDEHYGWYKESRGPGGKTIPPRLSLTEPVTVVPKDRTIVSLNNQLRDRYGENFRNSLREGSDARLNQVEFTGARDMHELMTINDKGSRGNPIYSYEPAKLVDPITAMNKGLSRIINSTFMDDYKIFAAEHWLEQAKDFLNVDKSDLRAAALYHFNHPEFKPVSAENIKQISILKGNWKKAKDFIGTPSIVDNTLHYISQSLVDSIYRGVGPKGEIVPTSWLSKMSDPLGFARNMSFHAYLGLFSIKQFLTQATTYTNIFAISPRHAPSGAMATMLYAWSRVNRNPGILAHMDSLATKLRTYLPGMSHFKPGEWLEATKEMEAAGFMNVSHESALRDTPLTNKVITNGKDKFLEWGELPFKRGAESTRISAWYTAYREFRDANPTGRITREDRESILNRAGDLDHNMSRASSSILHTGVASVPAQFFAYDMRLTELMTGKRLTPGEKARLFGVSSLLYGVPIGGLGLWSYPAGDIIRKKALDLGYVVGDNQLQSFFMEGLPAMIMASITGGYDPKAGNWYNFSKFGAKGLDVLNDMFDGNKTLMDILGGAPYSMLTNTWQGTSGLRTWFGSFLRNDNRVFPIKPADFIDPFKEVAAVSDTRKMIAAVNTGRWISKNETYLSDTSIPNAIFQVLSGLNMQENVDVRSKKETMDERKKMQTEGLSNFLREFHRSLEAFANKDTQQGQDFYNRAQAYLIVSGFPDEKRASALSLAYDSNKSLIDKIDPDYFTKNLPPDIRDSKLDAYRRTLQMQQNRGAR
jgi:hypothetical protein